MASAELDAAIAAAVAKALDAGLSAADVAAALTRVAEMLEADE